MCWSQLPPAPGSRLCTSLLSPCSLASCWWVEISYGGSIYTRETGKRCKSGIFHAGSQLLSILCPTMTGSKTGHKTPHFIIVETIPPCSPQLHDGDPSKIAWPHLIQVQTKAKEGPNPTSSIGQEQGWDRASAGGLGEASHAPSGLPAEHLRHASRLRSQKRQHQCVFDSSENFGRSWLELCSPGMVGRVLFCPVSSNRGSTQHLPTPLLRNN